MFLNQDSSFVLSAQLTNTAASQVEISVSYKDNTDTYHPDAIVATNDTTPVVLLSAPSSGVVNLVETVKLYNPDTQAHTVQILASAKVVYTCTVGANQSLVLSEEVTGNGLGYTPLAVDGDGSQLTGLTKAQVGLGNVVNVDTSTTANITDSAGKRFMTDAEKTVLDNTSGVNTGDETASSIESKLGVTPANVTALSNLSGTNTGDETQASIISKIGATPADYNLSNLTSTGKAVVSNLASPSDVSMDITVTVTTGTRTIFTAPTDGQVIVELFSTGYAELILTNTGTTGSLVLDIARDFAAGASNAITGVVRVKKNDIITLYTATSNYNVLVAKFIYAEGSKP